MELQLNKLTYYQIINFKEKMVVRKQTKEKLPSELIKSENRLIAKSTTKNYFMNTSKRVLNYY